MHTEPGRGSSGHLAPEVTRRIIWVACMVGAVTYGVVGYVVFEPQEAQRTAPVRLWYVSGLGCAVATLLAPRAVAAAGRAQRPGD